MEYAIEVEHLVKTFRTPLTLRKVEAVRDISFKVKKGQIFGFLGPNGAGKTTTIKVLTSLIQPTKGKIRVLGGRIGELKVAKRIGYLPETPNFYDYLSAEEFLDIVARFYGLSGRERAKKIDELLELVGIGYAKKRKLRKFSKGMLQRVGIAQALIGDPELIILDEPLSGLDPIGRKQVRDIIAEQKKKGKTIFFSSHILSDIEMICDEVAILNKGKVVATGPLDELLRPEKVQAEVVVDGHVDQNILKEQVDKIEYGPDFSKVLCTPDKINDVLKALIDGGYKIKSLTEVRITLEDLIMMQAFNKEDEK